MSAMSVILYALLTSLFVSTLSLLVARAISRRRSSEPGEDVNAQILRLVSMSLATEWAPNAAIAARAKTLLDSGLEFDDQQREVLEWLYDIVRSPDADLDALPQEDEPFDEEAFLPENITLVAPARKEDDDEETPAHLPGAFDSRGPMELAAEIRELSTELQTATDPDRRASAAIKLGRLGQPGGVPYLVRALRHDDTQRVQTFSAVALGMIGADDAVSPLIEVIQKQVTQRIEAPIDLTYGGYQLIRALQREIDPEPEDWLGQNPIAAEIWALGKIGSPQACVALVERLHDVDPGIRWFASWALGKIGDESTALALADLIDDPVDDVRWIAIWGLGRMNSTAAVPRLIEVSRDPNPSIRRIAIWALGRGRHIMARQAAMEALSDPERGVRQVASWALARVESQIRQSA
ncbi:MAG TPA: HEAT repeat domain-containing protein [Thermomicrobiales bacterium]|nr:HEAT repeat domain-containing protein [Thermomicrobiales bacterium]